MSEETETGTQTFGSSSETIELRSSQETEMEPAFSETPDTELTLRSVNERIKQGTDPILKRVEELCALLASRTEMETAGNSEASGSKQDRALSSPSRNRYDTWYSIFFKECQCICLATLRNLLALRNKVKPEKCNFFWHAEHHPENKFSNSSRQQKFPEFGVGPICVDSVRLH